MKLSCRLLPSYPYCKTSNEKVITLTCLLVLTNDFVNENRRQKIPFSGLIKKLGLPKNVFVKHNRVSYGTLNKSKHYFSKIES